MNACFYLLHILILLLSKFLTFECFQKNAQKPCLLKDPENYRKHYNKHPSIYHWFNKFNIFSFQFPFNEIEYDRCNSSPLVHSSTLFLYSVLPPFWGANSMKNVATLQFMFLFFNTHVYKLYMCCPLYTNALLYCNLHFSFKILRSVHNDTHRIDLIL